LLNRVVFCLAKELAFDLHAITSDKGQEYQRAFFRKVLDQPVLQDVLPYYVSQHRRLELCRVVCDGLKEAWSGLNYGIGRQCEREKLRKDKNSNLHPILH
jgi:hypothetical protein